MQLRAADLFCGAGGLSEGFRQAGFQIAAGNDVDPDACASYAANFPEAALVCGDIRQDAVRERVLAAAAGAAVLTGGPPCQAFSQVRNHVRLIDDPRNALYREFVRAVAAIAPAAFVMENVQGLEQMGVKEQVLRDLCLDGEYRVRLQILDAADFGVPQTRKRLFFTGLRRSLGLAPPELTGTGATAVLALERHNGAAPVRYEVAKQRDSPAAALLLRRLGDPEDAAVVSAGQAIADLAGLGAGARRDELEVAGLPPPTSAYQRQMRLGLGPVLANVSVPRLNADTALRLRGVPQGGNYRDFSPDLLARYLTGARWGPHNGTGLLTRKHYYAYRKLHPAMWSWTLNTKADSVYHYGAVRVLSVREFARLQSFPDRFVFTTDPRRGALPGRIDGAAHSRYRQAGNAVPPLLARAVASMLRECLLAVPLPRSVA